MDRSGGMVLLATLACPISMQRLGALENFSYGPTALQPTTRPGQVGVQTTAKVSCFREGVTLEIWTQGWTALKLGNKGRVGVRNLLASSLFSFCQNPIDTRYSRICTD